MPWLSVASLLQFSYCITVRSSEHRAALSQPPQLDAHQHQCSRPSTACHSQLSSMAWVMHFDSIVFVEWRPWAKCCGRLWKFKLKGYSPHPQIVFLCEKQTCKQGQNPKLIVPTWDVQRTAGKEAPPTAQEHPKGLPERGSFELQEPKGVSSRRRAQGTVTLWKGEQLSLVGACSLTGSEGSWENGDPIRPFLSWAIVWI